MIDLKNLDKWVQWPKGKSLRFGSAKLRNLRLTVNAPARTRLSLVSGKDAVFLATVDGLQVVQFVADGPVELVADGPCAVYSSEFEEISVAVPDAVIFTKIAQRKARNPELEAMMARMSANMEKRLAIAERDIASRVAALAKKEKANADDTGKAADGTGTPVPGQDKGTRKSGQGDGAAEPAGA